MVKPYIFLFFTIPLIYSSSISVGENNPVDINCGSNHVIAIEAATWKFNPTSPTNYLILPNWRNFVMPLNVAGVICSYDKVFEVKLFCHGHEHCNFLANRTVLGDDCNYWLELNINYECHSCDQSRRRRRGSEDSKLFDLCKSQYFEVLRPHGSRTNQHILGDQSIYCPNHEFLDKHMNTLFPNTVDGARQFAQRIARMRLQSVTSATSLHTVFHSESGMSYREQYGRFCIFERPASKYDCRLRHNAWTCTYEGEVVAVHNKMSGHYHSELDRRYSAHELKRK